jgi:hypothetical protein
MPKKTSILHSFGHLQLRCVIHPFPSRSKGDALDDSKDKSLLGLFGWLNVQIRLTWKTYNA